MEYRQARFGGLLISALFVFSGSWILSRHYQDPFPSLTTALSTSLVQLSDFSGIALGTRRLAADIAWIQTLQYYATPEADVPEEEAENGHGHYPLLLVYCERVARLDPYFSYVYYYGAGALGWNLDRLDEAEKLLQEGIKANPKEWRLQQYLAALGYQKNHDLSKLTQFLDSFIHDPDCPNLVRALLANIYKKQGNYRQAVEVWLIVLETHDPDYEVRAKDQIQQIVSLKPQPAGLKTY